MILKNKFYQWKAETVSFPTIYDSPDKNFKKAPKKWNFFYFLKFQTVCRLSRLIFYNTPFPRLWIFFDLWNLTWELDTFKAFVIQSHSWKFEIKSCFRSFVTAVLIPLFLRSNFSKRYFINPGLVSILFPLDTIVKEKS